MAKARAIAKRRKAVGNIKKITRTMQLIATAKFQQAFTRAMATKPYTRKITELVGELSAAGEQISHPLMNENKEADRSAHVVITSNRGLCGGYNASILRAAMAQDQALAAEGASADLFVVGKKGIAYYKFLRRAVAHAFGDLGDTPVFTKVEPIATDLMKRYVDGDFRTVDVTYMRFQSASRQAPQTIRLLPIQQEQTTGSAAAAATKPTATVQYDFSPEPVKLLAALLPVTVKVRLFQCFTDANVSEQVARMVAMKAATDAAGEMIKLLGQRYNRARQSQITMELLDILGGVEALK